MMPLKAAGGVSQINSREEGGEVGRGGAAGYSAAAFLNRDEGKEEFTDYWGKKSLYSHGLH